MEIPEMRSALETDYAKRAKFGDQLPAMPDWAVRRIFEKRSGMSLTPLPRGLEVRTIRSIVATRSRAVSPALATDSEREAVQRRIRATQIALLQ